MLIRPETPEDHAAIHALHRQHSHRWHSPTGQRPDASVNCAKTAIWRSHLLLRQVMILSVMWLFHG